MLVLELFWKGARVEGGEGGRGREVVGVEGW